MTLLETHLYTTDDFWEWSQLSDNADKRTYLIEGVIYDMGPASWIHGDTTMELSARLHQYVRRHGLGRITAAETGYILGDDTVLGPDIGFIAVERIPAVLPKGFVPFAPDMAVEVVSPSNRSEDIRLKVEKYLQYGTRMVWVVYPEKRKVDVYEPLTGGATVKFLSETDTLDGGNVLVGFHLPLSELFELNS